MICNWGDNGSISSMSVDANSPEDKVGARKNSSDDDYDGQYLYEKKPQLLLEAVAKSKRTIGNDDEVTQVQRFSVKSRKSARTGSTTTLESMSIRECDITDKVSSTAPITGITLAAKSIFAQLNNGYNPHNNPEHLLACLFYPIPLATKPNQPTLHTIPLAAQHPPDNESKTSTPFLRERRISLVSDAAKPILNSNIIRDKSSENVRERRISLVSDSVRHSLNSANLQYSNNNDNRKLSFLPKSSSGDNIQNGQPKMNEESRNNLCVATTDAVSGAIANEIWLSDNPNSASSLSVEGIDAPQTYTSIVMNCDNSQQMRVNETSATKEREMNYNADNDSDDEIKRFLLTLEASSCRQESKDGDEAAREELKCEQPPQPKNANTLRRSIVRKEIEAQVTARRRRSSFSKEKSNPIQFLGFNSHTKASKGCEHSHGDADDDSDAEVKRFLMSLEASNGRAVTGLEDGKEELRYQQPRERPPEKDNVIRKSVVRRGSAFQSRRRSSISCMSEITLLGFEDEDGDMEYLLPSSKFGHQPPLPRSSSAFSASISEEKGNRGGEPQKKKHTSILDMPRNRVNTNTQHDGANNRRSSLKWIAQISLSVDDDYDEDKDCKASKISCNTHRAVTKLLGDGSKSVKTNSNQALHLANEGDNQSLQNLPTKIDSSRQSVLCAPPVNTKPIMERAELFNWTLTSGPSALSSGDDLEDEELDLFLQTKFNKSSEVLQDHHNQIIGGKAEKPVFAISMTKAKHRSSVKFSCDASTTSTSNGSSVSREILSLAGRYNGKTVLSSTPTGQRLAFSHFSLLSVRPETLLEQLCNGMGIKDKGSNHLDPFVLKQASLVDQFPSSSLASQQGYLSQEVLSTFCCPTGILVRVFPRCAIEGAKRKGWLGKSCDRYQVHAFTDEKGDLAHVIAIVTREELNCEQRMLARIFAEFKTRQKKRRSAKLIAHWCRAIYRICFLHTAVHNEAESDHHERRRSAPFAMTTSSRRTFMDNIRRFGSNLASLSSTGDLVVQSSLQPQSQALSDGPPLITRRVSDNLDLRRSLPITGFKEMNSSIDQRSQLFDSAGRIERSRRQTTKKRGGSTRSRYSEAAALTTYQSMLAADKLGDVCVVEKCYIFVGTKSDEHALLFNGLQQLLDIEREDNCLNALKQRFIANSDQDTKPKAFNKRRLSLMIDRASILSQGRHNHDSSASKSSILSLLNCSQEQKKGENKGKRNPVSSRHTILGYIQNTLLLSPSQTATTHPKNEHDTVNVSYEMKLPLSRLGKVSLKLPLPNVSDEWGLATLLLRIKYSALLVVLKLLLLERSVLIIGCSVEDVTICASSLRDLLEPYYWASAFMPLLPIEMLEFVCAPVPFIAGIVASDEKALAALEQDSRVKEALLNGLSIVNLQRRRVRVTSEPEIAEIVGNTVRPSPILQCYQMRLEEMAAVDSSALHSFRTFFTRGLSFRESLTLRSIKSIIKSELMSLSVVSSTLPDDCDINEATNINDLKPFDQPNFVDSLLRKMLSKFKYLEIMSQTQLFTGFVEGKMQAMRKREELLRGKDAIFIADWIGVRWRKAMGIAEKQRIIKKYTDSINRSHHLHRQHR